MLYYLKDGLLQKEGYTVITDDLKHDASAVATFEKAAIDHVRAKGVDIQAIHQWTDGCASQYKCHTSFANISMAETVHKAPVTRNYFETSPRQKDHVMDLVGSSSVKFQMLYFMTMICLCRVQQRCISSVSQDWLRLVNHPMCPQKVNIKQVPDHSNWLNKWIVQV